MSQNKCWCGRPTNLTLCNKCANQINTCLDDLDWAWDQLDLVLTRQTRIGDPAVRRGTSDALPLDELAMNTRDDINIILQSWCDLFQVRQGPPPVMCRNLAANKIWQSHPAGEDFYHEIRKLHRRAMKRIDIDDYQLSVICGCEREVLDEKGEPTGEACGGTIFLKRPMYQPKPDHADYKTAPSDTTVECRGCGYEWPGWQWWEVNRWAEKQGWEGIRFRSVRSA